MYIKLAWYFRIMYIYISLNAKAKKQIMKSIIFKSEKKAVVYEIFSAKDQGCYRKNELLRVVRTDDIDRLLSDAKYEQYAKKA